MNCIVYSRSLQSLGWFWAAWVISLFCATKHLNSKFDAILKLDLVWRFFKALFSTFCSQKFCSQCFFVFLSRSATWCPCHCFWLKGWFTWFSLLTPWCILKAKMGKFYFVVAPETPYSFFLQRDVWFPSAWEISVRVPCGMGTKEEMPFLFLHLMGT